MRPQELLNIRIVQVENGYYVYDDEPSRVQNYEKGRRWVARDILDLQNIIAYLATIHAPLKDMV